MEVKFQIPINFLLIRFLLSVTHCSLLLFLRVRKIAGVF